MQLSRMLIWVGSLSFSRCCDLGAHSSQVFSHVLRVPPETRNCILFFRAKEHFDNCYVSSRGKTYKVVNLSLLNVSTDTDPFNRIPMRPCYSKGGLSHSSN